MPHTNGIVSVPSEEGLTVRGPGERDDVGLLSLGTSADGISSQGVNNELALQVLTIRKDN